MGTQGGGRMMGRWPVTSLVLDEEEIFYREAYLVHNGDFADGGRVARIRRVPAGKATSPHEAD